MNERRKIALKVVPSSTTGPAVSAPPVLIASAHTVDYVCGSCNAVLMHAEEGQIHNVLIRCTMCGAYNSTDA